MSNFQLFWRQFVALTVFKNWIVLRNHRLRNIARNFLIPVAFSTFLANAPQLLIRPNSLGYGSSTPLHALSDVFMSPNKLVWTDTTGGAGSPSADQIMSIVTQNFSSAQLEFVFKVASTDQVTLACPSNFNSRSPCFAALTFTGLPTSTNTSAPLEYYIQGDAGLGHVNVPKHSSDYEVHIMPLQWAVDSAFLELQTGTRLPTPMEQPFTQEDDAQQKEKTRRNFLDSINRVFVIAFFLSFTGIIYQMAGSVAMERATGLTSHLQAMGCLRSARIISWHISLCSTFLPSWILTAVLWKTNIFTHTNVGLVIGMNLITGLSLASWSLLVSMPLGRSPQLAAIVSTAFAVAMNIVARAVIKTNGAACIFTILFPSTFLVSAMRALVQKELWLSDPNYSNSVPYPDSNVKIGAVMTIGALTIVIYPVFAMLAERRLYDTKPASTAASAPSLFQRLLGRKNKGEERPAAIDNADATDCAVHVKNISKTFNIGKKSEVVAITDLSLKIPKTGVFVILGSNGSGKSTLHGMIGDLISPTAGSIIFSGGATRAARGALGIVPQKNVLFPELTCYQTVRLWSAIKRPVNTKETKEDLTQLLIDCDLTGKIHYQSGKLSGGQKRKLQLAVGIVGGSEILLVDEATSGVDPLSRRAIWRTLCALRATRTIIFTTHFLDEADLLGDDVAILAAPGKLLAHAPPVSLKRQFGRGYILHLTMGSTGSEYDHTLQSVLQNVRSITPDASVISSFAPNASLELGTRDPPTVAAVLGLIETEKERLGITRYDTHGTSLEEVFLALMAQETSATSSEVTDGPEKKDAMEVPMVPVLGKTESDRPASRISLSDGRKISVLAQALVIFHKRALVARRSYVAPLLAMAIVLCAGCIPLTYFNGRHEDCSINQDLDFITPLYLPELYTTLNTTYNNDNITSASGISAPIISPANATASLDASSFPTASVPTNMTFSQDILANYRDLTIGGISIDPGTRQGLIAYESSSGSLAGASLLNLYSNVLGNEIRGTVGPRILAQYANFPATFSDSTGEALEWLGFFSLGIAIFPAFATLYVTRERVSGVKAMQLSNGLTPTGLHLGHLFAEMPVILISSTVMIVVWAAKASEQFADLGLMWVIFLLYGATSTLFSYAVSRFMPTALQAFATLAVYNVVLYILYLAGYLLTLTYAPAVKSASEAQIVHFSMSILGPVTSILRAVLVSLNVFSLRCDGRGHFSNTPNGSMLKYGGPITYLIVSGLLLFFFLVWTDSGRPLPFTFGLLRRSHANDTRNYVPGDDVLTEARRAETATNDPLRVLNISKRFGRFTSKAVDDVSFGVGNETLSLLGPNGAGKTTTFNIIRGGITPDEGDVYINGVSIRQHKNGARVGLGLCPQFSAIDNHLTVREHLQVYGRLKGLSGQNLESNMETMLKVTTLSEYAKRPASKLSGGNQRKLSLAISLMGKLTFASVGLSAWADEKPLGNPSVLLIDEYSTGIDPATKRHMWNTLRDLSVGKAVVITTHSMEEASALSSRVAILSGRMLAVGSVDELVSRYPLYEVHVNCRTQEETHRTHACILASFPDARAADDVSTRWEVPVTAERTLSDLFTALSEQGLPEYAVERLSLESVFLKTIRSNNSSLEGESA
ncbi:hypothetical protein FRB93_003631 [Tulasnella sp. JGI-2019a]|nr:hypothetical protein FRB93_003631 [Tulasnella sp. JGI-2019a]